MAFNACIVDRTVFLTTAREVVRFSFVVSNSISCLDLELCQHSAPAVPCQPTCSCCRLRSAGNFINTDEKFRKFFSASRGLLYTLHLDLPKGRECGLKDEPKPPVSCSHFSNSPHVAELRSDDLSACARHLSSDDFLHFNNFVEYALNTSFPKERLLKWLLEGPLFQILEPLTANKFIDCFYPETRDPALFKDFVLQFDIREFASDHEQPEILESLLYHAGLYGRRDLDNQYGNPIQDIILNSIYNQFYSNIGAVLKCIDYITFYYGDDELLIQKILYQRPNLRVWMIERITKWTNYNRFNHMLAIIGMYIDSNSEEYTEAATEALRLIWCSVPYVCITYEEMNLFFEPVLGEEVTAIHNFYVRATGEFHECAEPRSLQHFCRIAIRRTLRKNNFWIPEGIRRTGLPAPLQSFLNLEKTQPILS